MRISSKVPRAMCPRDGGPAPVRRVIRRNPHRTQWLFPSRRMGCVYPCESQGELEHLIWAEANGAVSAFYAQPEVVRWNDDGISRHHTPDLRVEFDDRRIELHEVKPLRRLNDDDRRELDRRTAVLVPLLLVRRQHP